MVVTNFAMEKTPGYLDGFTFHSHLSPSDRPSSGAMASQMPNWFRMRPPSENHIRPNHCSFSPVFMLRFASADEPFTNCLIAYDLPLLAFLQSQTVPKPPSPSLDNFVNPGGSRFSKLLFLLILLEEPVFTTDFLALLGPWRPFVAPPTNDIFFFAFGVGFLRLPPLLNELTLGRPDLELSLRELPKLDIPFPSQLSLLILPRHKRRLYK